MKYTLLQLVQKVLNDTNGEEVNSISDSVEAGQIASLAETLYYQVVVQNDLFVTNEITKLTAYADSEKPTFFYFPERVEEVFKVEYDTSSDGSFGYKEVHWVEPIDFFARMPTSGGLSVLEPTSGTTFRVFNDRMPSIYTSVDDTTIIMDAYDASIESTLQSSKTRCFTKRYPVFDATNDDYVPVLPDSKHPEFLATLTSEYVARFGGGLDAAYEKNARKMRSLSKRRHTRRSDGPQRPNYGAWFV